MSDWTENPAFVASTNYVEHEVNGETLRFHPISVACMFKLRRIAKPLAGALSILFQQNNSDTGLTQRKTADGTEETISTAISEKLAALRTQEQVDAWERLAEAITDKANGDVVGAVILDSLREVFPIRRGQDAVRPSTFMETIDIDCLIGMLRGVAQANKAVLSPLTEGVQGPLGEVLSATVG